MSTRYNRRAIVGASLGMGLGMTLPGIREAVASTPVASPAAAGWTMTDGRGMVVELPTTPTTIIAQTISGTTLWDFGIKVKGIFGDGFPADGETDPQMGDMNPNEVEVLGVWGSELDLERVIAMGAELFIDVSRAEDGTIWSLSPEMEASLREVCPTFVIPVYQQPMTDTIGRFEELATSLGADVTVPAIADAKAAFTEADAAFREAAAAKPDLKVLMLTGDPSTSAYFVSPLNGGGVGLYLLQAGLNIIEPENPDPEQLNVFETASWEQVGTYPADVILYDSRTDPAIFADDPLWSRLPAVQAGQVGRWYSTSPYSWQRFAPIVEEMTALVIDAEIVT